MPDVLPACFGDYGAASSENSSGGRSGQNLVMCLYRASLAGQCRLVSITWCKSLLGQGLSVSVDYPACQHTCNVDMKPWLFWKKQGSKCFEVGGRKVEVFWDLSSAKYDYGPEPQEGFFVAITCDEHVVLLLGDMHKEAIRKFHAEPTSPEATLLSKKEHVYGKQLYTTRAQFSESGRIHDIAIECHTGIEKDPRLSVRIDKQVVVQVKRLMWKFRGNQRITIDGLQIEVFWDVHNWLFTSSDGYAVFMFQTCVDNEKPWLREVGTPASTVFEGHLRESKSSCAPVLQWPCHASFKGKESGSGLDGFSLLLYAWKNE